MLAFTLSKFSLLILVVSVAAATGFFGYHLSESLKANAVNNLLDNYSNIASEMLSSPSYCDAVRIRMPTTVSIAGSELYYTMRVTVQEDPGTGQRYVVFSASDRTRPNQIIASSSVVTGARVELYTDEPGRWIKSDAPITIDPLSAAHQSNAFYFVKEQYGDDTFFYVFPCHIALGATTNCDGPGGAKETVGAMVRSERPVDSGRVVTFKCA